MIVLDTNVISEPLRPRPERNVVAWLDAQDPETLFLSAITIAELLAGVAALPAGKRRRDLQETFDSNVFPLFSGRVLSLDEEAATAFAAVNSRAVAAGNPISFADAAIAAIAQAHGFAVATRNVKDFRGTGVMLIDPWSA